MSAIEERAKRYTNRNGMQYLSGFEQAEYDAYVKGATDQQNIDIEKAYHALKKVVSKEVLEELKKILGNNESN